MLRRKTIDNRKILVTKRRIAIGLCLFLTLTPFIGSYICADNIFGEYIGNLTPYLHLTMPQLGGLPFAEAIGELFGLIIFLIGLIGFIILIFTRFKKVGGLLFLLNLTIIYCVMRAIGGLAMNIFSFSNYEIKAKIFIVAAILSDIAWGIFCYWATAVLKKEKPIIDRQRTKHIA